MSKDSDLTETGVEEKDSELHRRNLLKIGGLGVLGLPLLAGQAGAHEADAYFRNQNLFLGNSSDDGDVVLRGTAGSGYIHLDADSSNRVPTSRIYANGRYGNLTLGGDGEDGDLVLSDGQGRSRVHLNGAYGGPNMGASVRVFVDGANGNIRLGSAGSDGDIFLQDSAGNGRVRLRANENVIDVYDDNGDFGVRIDGNRDGGDIYLGSKSNWLSDLL